MTHLLIATPCYDEKLTSSYVATTTQLIQQFERATPRIESDLFMFSHALVAYARNVFASRLLENPQYTHLLMIDADMGFHPSLVTRMLEMDKDVCAAIYPQRQLDLDQLITAARAMPADNPENRKKALHSSYKFVAEGDIYLTGAGAERKVDIDRGFVKAQAAGTGVMLIKRRVLERMRSKFPDLVAPTVPGGATTLTKEFFQPFNEYRLPDGHFLSEDLSFCHRWTKELGGEIWVNIDVDYIHHGQMRFQAAYLNKLLSVAVRHDIKY